jgi:hypothetical protein
MNMKDTLNRSATGSGKKKLHAVIYCRFGHTLYEAETKGDPMQDKIALKKLLDDFILERERSVTSCRRRNTNGKVY